MGRAYELMNPRRKSRPELIRCHCIKCGKTLYFNSKRGRFESDLPIGGKAVEDPHRPRCNKCLALRKRPGATVPQPYSSFQSVRRVAIRAEALRKNPLLAPVEVRYKVEGVKAEPNQIVAVRYSCPHLSIWKTPDGKLLHEWRRRPGESPKARRWSGIHYERYRERMAARKSSKKSRQDSPTTRPQKGDDVQHVEKRTGQ
jgi:hypothetical protein